MPWQILLWEFGLSLLASCRLAALLSEWMCACSLSKADLSITTTTVGSCVHDLSTKLDAAFRDQLWDGFAMLAWGLQHMACCI
jgi:hypothetical protein